MFTRCMDQHSNIFAWPESNWLGEVVAKTAVMHQFSASRLHLSFFFFQAEDGIRDYKVTGVQTCALPICPLVGSRPSSAAGSAGIWGTGAGAGAATGMSCACARASTCAGSCSCTAGITVRSEERRVGEEGRSRWSPDHLKKKKTNIVLSSI